MCTLFKCPLVLNAFLTPPPPSHPFNFLLIVLLGCPPPPPSTTTSLPPRCHGENSFLWATCRLLNPAGRAHEAEQEIPDLCFLSAEIEVTCMMHVWHACTWPRSPHACRTTTKKTLQKCLFFFFWLLRTNQNEKRGQLLRLCHLWSFLYTRFGLM